MEKIKCIYYEDGRCSNTAIINSLVKNSTKCILQDAIRTDKTMVVCKLQTSVRLVGGIWSVY
jgi:hypothetical protein